MFVIGQRVVLNRNIYEAADDCHPGGFVGLKRDQVTIKRIVPGSEYPYKVAHDDVPEGMTFGVSAAEIDPL